MARKKRNKKFGAVERARLRARHAAGLPPAERVITPFKHKPPKHKKALMEDELAGYD